MPALFTIRPAHAEESGAIADLVGWAPAAELCDFEYGSVTDLIAFDQSLAETDAPISRLVAIDSSGALIGTAFAFRVPWTAREQHYWSGVRVDGSARCRGVGQELFRCIADQVCNAGGRTLAIETRVSNTALVAICLRHGLVEVYRSTEWRIDLRTAEPPLTPVWEYVQLQGIDIKTLPELQRHDPEWLAKLHQLYITLARDVPIPERATITPTQLAEFVSELPISLPAACFVAVDAGRYVGVSFMHQALAEPILYQKLTGVLADHRGHGIALALKLATLHYARTHGFEQISTWIESNNLAMLKLSRKLGFTEQPGGIAVLEMNL